MTLAEAPAPPRPVVETPSPPGGARALRLLLIVLLVGIALTGAVLVLDARSSLAQADSYRSAPRCAVGIDATPGVDCFSISAAGSILATADTHTSLGARRSSLVVAVPERTPTALEVQPTPSWSCVGAGGPAELKSWHGTVTAVYTRFGSFPTEANPTLNDAAGMEGGISLLAVSFVVPLAVLIERRRAQRTPAGSVRPRFYASALNRAAVGAFLAGQAADVLTSALGYDRNLIEANQPVAIVVNLVGPAGFVLSRIPAVGLLLLAVQRIPRRAALVVLFGAAILFLSVGAHNLYLVLSHTGGSASTCSQSALP